MIKWIGLSISGAAGISILATIAFYTSVIINDMYPPPIDCKLGDWKWDSCTKTCGGGTERGTRNVLQEALNGGLACSGETVEIRNCSTQSCPGKH